MYNLYSEYSSLMTMAEISVLKLYKKGRASVLPAFVTAQLGPEKYVKDPIYFDNRGIPLKMFMEMYTWVRAQCGDIGYRMLKAVGCDIWNEYNLV